MAITGAIFDCDGTLVDSMPMWKDVSMSWLFGHFGASTPEGFFERVEPISLMGACEIVHDEYGYGQSSKAVYEEVCAHVREAYASEVELFCGAREFLQELADAGIPMVIASSTPVRELKSALGAHGLLGYFKDIVSTEDVGGRDKEFPDVYLEAQRRLGTPAESTWVFEDAPFGVKTSHDAGFKVVGLMNDHDGRREKDVRPWCDVYVHGYAELSLALLRDYERPAQDATGEPLQVLVVDGSPCPSSPGLVMRLAAASDYVVCADGGAATCRAAGVIPNAFCGDNDSADADAASWANSGATTNIRFPAEKYATDLSLALDIAAHEAARQARPLALTVTCASGGRPDHALAVVGLLASATSSSARVVEDGYELRILRPDGTAGWEIGPELAGATFSAIALAPATRVDERGMRWELEDYELALLGDLGISNVVGEKGATVSCRSGVLGAYLIS